MSLNCEWQAVDGKAGRCRLVGAMWRDSQDICWLQQVLKLERRGRLSYYGLVNLSKFRRGSPWEGQEGLKQQVDVVISLHQNDSFGQSMC